MASYECRYTSGRQFVFEERRSRGWLLTGLVAMALVGLLLGLGIGVTISIAGVFVFEALMVSCAIYTAYKAYLFSFRKESSSSDVSSYLIMNLFVALNFVAFLGCIRLCQRLNIDSISRSVLLTCGCVVLGIIFWSYLRFALREDERKHHLGQCRKDGTFDDNIRGIEEEQPDMWDDLLRFLVWILKWRWWTDLLDSPCTDQECLPENSITIHNRTLKLIKVCFYSPDDMFCWVPFGGVSGRFVALVRAEEHRTFHLGRRANAGRRTFQLKVFQPGLFDRELACLRQAKCNQDFAFCDVEGMVRRSKALSAKQMKESSSSLADSSEDEFGATLSGFDWAPSKAGGNGMLSRCSAVQLQTTAPTRVPFQEMQPEKAIVGGSVAGSLQRSESLNTLTSTCAGSTSPESLPAEVGRGDSVPSSGATSEDPVLGLLRKEELRPRTDSSKSEASEIASRRSEPRRARPQEIVIRNKSKEDIQVRLFRTCDFCFLVPVTGIMTGGECLKPADELRLELPTIPDNDFTLKVYSVGAGSRELTYFTVSRGQAYTFNDSLIC